MKRIFSFIFALTIAPLLSVPIKWSSSPLLLSSPGVNATNPQIGIAQNGTLVAVWCENSTLYGKVKPVNGNWGSSSVLSMGAASSPNLVVDPAGNATVVWLESGIVKAVSRPAQGTWGTVISLSDAHASSPSLAVDANGNLVAVWARNEEIQSSTKLFNHNWQSRPDKLSITGIASDTPKVAIGANGTAVATWHGISDSVDTVFAASKMVSGAWGVAGAISDAMNSTNATVAVDPSGNAVAIWYAFNQQGDYYSDVIVKSAFLSSEGNWTLPVALTQNQGDTNPSILIPCVCFDASGNALAAWNNSSKGQYTIESAVLPTNGSWSTASTIDSGTYLYAEDLSVDAQGNAILTYMNGSYASIGIQYSQMSAGASNSNQWAQSMTISTNSQNGYPSVASTVQGNTIYAGAVWLGSKNTGIGSVYSVTGTGTCFAPPNYPKVIQTAHNFSIFTEYTNTISWLPSTDPNLTGYVIYRNGEVILTVPSTVLVIKDLNRDPNVSDTYGIAAFGPGSEQSAPVIVTYP